MDSAVDRVDERRQMSPKKSTSRLSSLRLSIQNERHSTAVREKEARDAIFPSGFVVKLEGKKNVNIEIGER